MNDRVKPDAQGQKKPYVKPAVRKVTLIPEEAVLGSCKVTGFTNGATFSR